MATLSIRHELGSIAAEMRKVNENKEGWSAAEVEERFDALNKRAAAIEQSVQDEARTKRIEDLATKANDVQLRTAPAPVARATRTGPTASPEYRDAFWRYLSTGNMAEVRAITGSTTNIGLPDDMYRTLVEKLYQPTNLLGRLNRLAVDGDKKFAIGNALPTSAFVAENTSITASDPSFSAQVTVDPVKLVCRTTASIEALADAVGNPDMQGYIMKQQATSMAILLEQAIVRGGVSGAWTDGLEKAPVTASQTVAVTGAYSALTGDNIIDAAHKVAPQYRTGNFFWVMDDTALKTIRKIKAPSAASTDYIWKPDLNGGLVGGFPGTIYGIPYVVCQSVDAAETTNARILIGNFDYATLFERLGMQMLVDPYSGSSTLAVNLYTYARFDFKVLLAEAFAGITFSTAS